MLRTAARTSSSGESPDTACGAGASTRKSSRMAGGVGSSPSGDGKRVTNTAATNRGCGSTTSEGAVTSAPPNRCRDHHIEADQRHAFDPDRLTVVDDEGA